MLKEYSSGKVAAILSVTGATIDNWIKDGRLKARKSPGGQSRIAHDELVRFMNENSIPLDRIDDALNFRVLVIDNEPSITRLLTTAIKRRKGLDAISAHSGLEAGFLLARYRPHIVVLDIRLEDVDGREICHTIRHDPELCTTQIIGISGLISDEEGKALLEQGFDMYIQKPIDPPDLVAAIRNLLAKRRVRIKPPRLPRPRYEIRTKEVPK